MNDNNAAKKFVLLNESEEVKGFRIHSTVCFAVAITLALINFALTPEFLWFLFPLTGMGLGVAFHYYFGVKKV